MAQGFLCLASSLPIPRWYLFPWKPAIFIFPSALIWGLSFWVSCCIAEVIQYISCNGLGISVWSLYPIISTHPGWFHFMGISRNLRVGETLRMRFGGTLLLVGRFIWTISFPLRFLRDNPDVLRLSTEGGYAFHWWRSDLSAHCPHHWNRHSLSSNRHHKNPFECQYVSGGDLGVVNDLLHWGSRASSYCDNACVHSTVNKQTPQGRFPDTFFSHCFLRRRKL